MITGLDYLSSMFDVFHDGGLIFVAQDGADLVMQVEILYLAERVHPDYSLFNVRLQGVRNLSSRNLNNEEVLTDLPAIFADEFEILSANVVGDGLEVLCVKGFGDSLMLSFRIESAVVTDEGGKDYSIEDLVELSNGYWEEFRKGR